MADPSETWTINGVAILLSRGGGNEQLPTWNPTADRTLLKPKGSNRSVIVDNGLGSNTVPITAWVDPDHDALIRTYFQDLTLVSIRRDSGGELKGTWNGRVYQYSSNEIENLPEYMLAQVTLVMET
jgi:hypothetical protein